MSKTIVIVEIPYLRENYKCYYLRFCFSHIPTREQLCDVILSHINVTDDNEWIEMLESALGAVKCMKPIPEMSMDMIGTIYIDTLCKYKCNIFPTTLNISVDQILNKNL